MLGDAIRAKTVRTTRRLSLHNHCICRGSRICPAVAMVICREACSFPVRPKLALPHQKQFTFGTNPKEVSLG